LLPVLPLCQLKRVDSGCSHAPLVPEVFGQFLLQTHHPFPCQQHGSGEDARCVVKPVIQLVCHLGGRKNQEQRTENREQREETESRELREKLRRNKGTLSKNQELQEHKELSESVIDSGD